MESQQSSRRNGRIANAVFFFISGFGYSAWASRIPTIREQLNLSDSTLGSLLLAMPLGLLCTLPFTTRLLKKYGSRSIMLFGALFFNIVLCLTGFIDNQWQLAVILFCFGSSRNLLNISINAQAVFVQRQYKNKSIITAFHGIWSIAGFAGAALGYLLVTFNIGIAWHFPAVGITMTLLALYQYKFILYEPPQQSASKALFAWPDKKILNFAFIVFICMACENTMYDWSGIYFRKTLYASASTATAAFASYMVMMTLGRFTGDRIVNAIGIRKTLLYSASILTAGLTLAVIIPHPITGFLGFMMVGMGVSCIAPLVFSLAGQTATGSSSTALTSISSISYFGFLLVPPLIGFVSEVAGMRVSFAIIAIMAATMILLIRKIRNDSHEIKEHTEEAIV